MTSKSELKRRASRQTGPMKTHYYNDDCPGGHRMSPVGAAKHAIATVFADKGVPPRDTLANLEELAADLDAYIDAIKSDLSREKP